MTVTGLMCAGLCLQLTDCYRPGMRIYIQDNSKFYLLDSVESFGYGLYGKDSRIWLSHSGDSKVLLYSLDEATAVRGLEELLSLTADNNDGGAAIISWDGEHFTKRAL